MVASCANFCNSVWNWSARRSASLSIAARTDLASIIVVGNAAVVFDGDLVVLLAVVSEEEDDGKLAKADRAARMAGVSVRT